LDALYADLAPRGLEILAFPSGEFGDQELATDGEIQAWAKGRGTAFPVFAKASVNGADEIPVYTFLKSRLGGVFQEVKWNFGQHKGDSTSLQRECSARARFGNSTHASRALREMIARPKISRNEWKTAEIGAFDVGNVALFCCPGGTSASSSSTGPRACP
jgi:glutathione peroxidase-family protein